MQQLHLKMIATATAGALCLAAVPGLARAGNCASDAASGLAAYKVGPHTVLAYVPESAVGTHAPLVVNLHPTGGTGLDTINESRQVAEDNGFVMIAPTGVIGPVFSGWTWNVPGVPTFGGDNYPAEDARNDVEFIARAIDGAVENLCIDEARIYAMGFSGGARMASQLACDMSDRLASVVAIGGIRFPEASDTALGLPKSVECKPARAIPMQAIHGRLDPTNPWSDQAAGETPFVDPFKNNEKIVAGAPVQGTSWSYSGETALARWVANNGCDASPRIRQLADGIEERDYQNCKDGAEVSLVFFDQLGHAVPGYNKPWAPEQANSPIDGYTLAWELLKDDSLPQK